MYLSGNRFSLLPDKQSAIVTNNLMTLGRYIRAKTQRILITNVCPLMVFVKSKNNLFYYLIFNIDFVF